MHIFDSSALQFSSGVELLCAFVGASFSAVLFTIVPNFSDHIKPPLLAGILVLLAVPLAVPGTEGVLPDVKFGEGRVGLGDTGVGPGGAGKSVVLAGLSAGSVEVVSGGSVTDVSVCLGDVEEGVPEGGFSLHS